MAADQPETVRNVSDDLRHECEVMLSQRQEDRSVQHGDAFYQAVLDLIDERGARCITPPPGWRCTRVAGHDGPCAAVPT